MIALSDTHAHTPIHSGVAPLSKVEEAPSLQDKDNASTITATISAAAAGGVAPATAGGGGLLPITAMATTAAATAASATAVGGGGGDNPLQALEALLNDFATATDPDDLSLMEAQDDDDHSNNNNNNLVPSSSRSLSFSGHSS